MQQTPFSVERMPQVKVSFITVLSKPGGPFGYTIKKWLESHSNQTGVHIFWILRRDFRFAFFCNILNKQITAAEEKDSH